MYKKRFFVNVSYKWLLFSSLILVSCNNDDDNTGAGSEEKIEVSSGEADFSTFVALGNSMTAGYTDGALFMAGQQNSFPNMLSQKFSLAGGGTFSIPYTDDNIGGMLFGGTQIFENRLFFNGSGPQRLPGNPTTEISNIKPGPYNNMGIPGAKSFHLLANGYGNIAGVQAGLANPYFVRMASSNLTSVVKDAIDMKPTFYSLWLGSNDVLAYAAAGGDGINQAGNFDPATYGFNDITDPNVFAEAFATIVGALYSVEAKGVVANIPDVTSLPYFTTVPYAPLDPSNPSFGPQIPTLNMIFGALNQIYAALGQPQRTVVFSSTAASPVLIKDENLADIALQIENILNASPTFPAFIGQFGLPPQAAPKVAKLLGKAYGQTRQATANDLLVLPSSAIIGTINQASLQDLMSQGLPAELAGQFSVEGITYPLADNWVLLPEEQTEVKTATASFNSSIKAIADEYELAFVDAHALFNEISQTGVRFDEYTLNSSLVFGGVISLDGIHPTARGYAFFTNQFLKAIDATYGSNFEEAGALLKAADYTTLYPVSM